jgi:subtilisin family serine protease
MSRVLLRAVSAALVAVSVAACTDAPVQAPQAEALTPRLARSQSAPEAVVTGELIVKVRDASDAGVAAVGRAHGLALKALGHGRAFALYKVTPGQERAAAVRLAADPRVEYAEPNYLRQPTVDPRLWAFHNPGNLKVYFNSADTQGREGQVVTSFISKLDADEDAASAYAAGGTSVIIGSIDTGVDFGHSELSGRLIAGRDWFAGDNDPSDTPDEGHGTHTTGTMAGRTVGVAGVTGAAAQVRVHVQRVCGPGGCPTSAIVNAIRAAADYPGMVAMNLSLGGSSESTAEKNAIHYAVNTKNVLVIASAGNSGTSRVGCPACDPNAISVAATNWQDGLAYYTNYGKGLDISAPGGVLYTNTTDEAGILSSVPANYNAGPFITINGARYAYFQGTSMAAPQVTGTAAIVASKTTLRGANLRNRLLNTADDKGTAGYDTKFGAGRLNSYRAVTNSLTSPQ